jgi:hypothetical protein
MSGDTLPVHRVPRGQGSPRDLPAAATLRDLRVAELAAIPLTRADGSAGTVGEVLADTCTDAWLVLHGGELVAERYGPLGAADRPHALMSVTKSVVGCVAAVLIDRGLLDADREVTSYVPELAASGYVGASVRDVLDMRSGVAFVEDYADPESDIRRLDECIAGSGGLYWYLTTLRAQAPHGVRFLYRSAESDVLGWVCERAAGAPMAELISDLIWGADGRRARRRPAARRPGGGRTRRRPVRHRPRRGQVRPDAA